MPCPFQWCHISPVWVSAPSCYYHSWEGAPTWLAAPCPKPGWLPGWLPESTIHETSAPYPYVVITPQASLACGVIILMITTRSRAALRLTELPLSASSLGNSCSCPTSPSEAWTTSPQVGHGKPTDQRCGTSTANGALPRIPAGTGVHGIGRGSIRTSN